MRGRGLAVLLVEQKLAIALDLCDRVAVLGQGRIVFEGPPAALRADTQVQSEWLAV
jgi:branched-chain amino acid transport system ATP-binding protein